MLALIFYVNRSKRVELKFYVICTMLGEITSKASTLFGSIEYAMKRNIIRWENVDSIGLGNSRTNIGRRNSIKSRTFIVGCNWSCISGFNDYKQVKGWGSHSRPPLFFSKGAQGKKESFLSILNLQGLNINFLGNMVTCGGCVWNSVV